MKMAAKLLEEAAAAFQGGKAKEAIDLATKAGKLDPKNPAAPFVAGSAHLSLRQNDEAARGVHDAHRARPQLRRRLRPPRRCLPEERQVQGGHRRLRQVPRVRPKLAPDHWRRGIALYYAGKFDDGRKQFDLHRTVNPEDVENSAWHYLCNARANTPKKAREDLIPVTKDARVPMKQVLELFAGKIKPPDVLDAAENAQAEGRGADRGAVLRQPVRRPLLRERGRREEGARTPHGSGGEVQDRPLHVGRRAMRT